MATAAGTTDGDGGVVARVTRSWRVTSSRPTRSVAGRGRLGAQGEAVRLAGVTTADGITVSPLYVRDAPPAIRRGRVPRRGAVHPGLVHAAPRANGTWECAVVVPGEPGEANRRVLDDLERGVTSVVVDHPDPATLGAVLEGVVPGPGADRVAGGRRLRRRGRGVGGRLWSRGIDPADALGGFGCRSTGVDPRPVPVRPTMSIAARGARRARRPHGGDLPEGPPVAVSTLAVRRCRSVGGPGARGDAVHRRRLPPGDVRCRPVDRRRVPPDRGHRRRRRRRVHLDRQAARRPSGLGCDDRRPAARRRRPRHRRSTPTPRDGCSPAAIHG